MNKKQRKNKYELRRGAYFIKMPEKHVGTKMVFPISVSDIPYLMGAEYRIMLSVDSHPKASRQIKEIIVVYEDKVRLVTGGKLNLKKMNSLWNSVAKNATPKKLK